MAERAHRLDVVERFLGTRIGQVIPLLQTVDAQHHGDRKCSAAVRTSFGIMWLNQSFQRRPRHHRRHLGQEYVPLRALLLACKVQRRKAQLTVHRRTSESIAPVCHLRTIDQSFPRSKNKFAREMLTKSLPLPLRWDGV